MRKRRRRVPVVLWRLFGDKAQTLYTTLTSLIIPQQQQSHGSDYATSFLIHPHDPSDYVKLLNHCFVVLNHNAPPFVTAAAAAKYAPPINTWPQHEIVVRSIEMILREQSTAAAAAANNNVLCSGYDKYNHSSPIVELLTSSAWSLLLERVGDDIMVYLLKHTSIFLPLPPNKHCQVAGLPVNSLALKVVKRPAEPQPCRKKRDRVDNANSTSYMQQLNSICSTGCGGCVSCNDIYIKPFSGPSGGKNGQISSSEAAAPTTEAESTNCNRKPGEELVNLRKRSRPFRWQRCKKRKYSDINKSTSLPINGHPSIQCSQMNVLEAGSPTTGACTVNHEKVPTEKVQGLDHVMAKVKPKKHSRLFRWQRCKKLRHLDVEEASDSTCHLIGCTDEESTPLRFQCDLNNIRSHSFDKIPQRCTCCLVLQESNLVTKGAHVNRQPIFYNLEHSSSVLPRKHVLKILKPNFAGSKSLIETIFGFSNVNTNASTVQCSHSSGFCLIGSACMYHSLIKFLKILIRRTHYCKHSRFLDRHCIVPLLSKGNDSEREVSKRSHGVCTEQYNRTLASEDPQTNAIKSYCSKSQVVSFIWAVCRSLVPPDMLGTPSNWRTLRRNISKFIQLRRFEKFSIRQCMHKLKISEFPFLSDKNSLCCLDARVLNNVPTRHCKLNEATSTLKHMLLERWIFWFFSCLVVPLLQANFYVTESEHGKQDVFYFRKEIWEKLKNTTIAGLKDHNYRHLDSSEVRSIIGNRLFGFSKLRLRPKENGVRMLANLKAPSRILVQDSSSTGIPGKAQFFPRLAKYKYFKPVNYVLRDTYAVLKGILLKEPEKLGSSVFDYHDIYRKLCMFVAGLKNGSSAIPNVYIVVSDVSKAFDSVDQDQLLSIMKDILHEDKYFLQQSSQVVCTKKSLWVHENLTLRDSEIATGFTKKSSSARFGSLHTVLINQGLGRYMKKKEILFNLYEHVKLNVLQLDKTFYLQGIGIPQGSVLSSLLCSIYYGHLERNVLFPFIEKTRGPTVDDLSRRCNSQDAPAERISNEDRVVSSPCNILLRLIDDLCFISTSKKQAESFYIRLHRGFRDYNCYMNEEKFCLSFHSGHKLALPSNRVYVGEDGISFLRWSGLLLNSCTLEVQADYTRYLNNHLRSTLTVSWQRKPGWHLKAKLCGFMRPKCHPIFFDSNINTGPVVRLNIYQAFLLCAMKFHCYVSEMYICKLRQGFHFKIIKRSFRYLYALIKKMMCFARASSPFHPILHLEAGEVEWLGLNAFVKVLKRKQSRHKKLLHLLKLKLLAHEITGNESSELKYAVDSSHSSVMWKIKY